MCVHHAPASYEAISVSFGRIMMLVLEMSGFFVVVVGYADDDAASTLICWRMKRDVVTNGSRNLINIMVSMRGLVCVGHFQCLRWRLMKNDTRMGMMNDEGCGKKK